MASNEEIVTVINGLDHRRFQLFITRILSKLHEEDKALFSSDEEEKLAQVFGIDREGLNKLLNFCAAVFRKAAFHLSKPGDLVTELRDIHCLSDDHSQLMAQVWGEGARETVEQLKGRSLAPCQLTDMSWSLGVTLAHSSKANLRQPISCFEFTVRNNESVEQKLDHHQVEFSRSELFDFFQQLETIQGQLDSLSG